jgi:hypothetical protein
MFIQLQFRARASVQLDTVQLDTVGTLTRLGALGTVPASGCRFIVFAGPTVTVSSGGPHSPINGALPC